MAWLLRDGAVLASLEVAGDRAGRRRGLLGRDAVDGALLLRPAPVHTFGMRFAIDVIHCRPVMDDDEERLEVVRVVTMAPNRLGRPALRGGVVIEATDGAARRWGVVPGMRLEVRA